MGTISNATARGRARRPVGPLYTLSRSGSILSALFSLLLTWQERASQRHALSTLDDRMLKDMGLSRADVFLEARKPFWRV
jgi:uncharacterized protein YjiS (DUF1127 family)